MTETAQAFAKLNLSLDIVSKMPDGYHNIKTVMQTVSLCDEVTLECVPGEGVCVDPGLPYLPSDERNIAAKAALAFFAHTGIAGYRTNIEIRKTIPVCAGLGGGSADGACVLRMLDRVFSTNLGRRALESLGYDIGADVPFCIAGGTGLAEGRGELLTDLPPLPECSVVICKPPFICSTPELFMRVKCEKIHARPDTGGIVESLAKGDLYGVARRMYNVFEDVLPRGARDIEDIKYALLDYGAIGAVMTGSGSAVFGLYDSEQRAQEAHEHLKSNYIECYLTQTQGRMFE